MYRKTLISTAVALMTAGLVACGGGDDDNDNGPAPGPQPVEVGNAVALTADGRLFSFDREDPGTEVGSVQISGLAEGETIVGMDFRPVDGLLYGISSLGKAYRIDPSTGETEDLGALVAALNDDNAYTALSGTRFGVDWNPTADALRVVSDTGQNLRILPTARTANGAAQPDWATITDGALTQGGPAATNVSAAGYTNSFDAATSTALYVLDPDDDSVYQQNPPNDGVLVNPAPLGVDFDAVNGFDIDPSSNLGYAALTVGGSTQLYTLPVGAVVGVATAVGAIGDGSEQIVGLALNTPATATALGLTTDNRLVSFNPRTPNTVSAPVAITGLTNQTVVGIDVRPLDGFVYAVARENSTGQATLYRLDPDTGAVSNALALVQQADGTTPVVLPDSVYSVDFNPAADALRIVNDDGLNLRALPSAMSPAGAVRVAGATFTDGNLSRTGVVAAAYENSGVSATAPATTRLLDIDTGTDVLVVQAPPNDGTLTDVGALGFDAGTMAGFDIGGERNGIALAAFGGASGPFTLYTVNLTTGAATLPRGLTAATAQIGGASGVTLRDIAIRF